MEESQTRRSKGEKKVEKKSEKNKVRKKERERKERVRKCNKCARVRVPGKKKFFCSTKKNFLLDTM